MDHERHHVLAVNAVAQQRNTDWAFGIELEAVPTLLVKLLLQPGFAVLVGTVEGRAADRQIAGRIDHLIRHAVDFDVAGAQDFVTCDDVTDGRDQRLDIPRTAQFRGERNVVDPAGTVDAVGEPAAQL